MQPPWLWKYQGDPADIPVFRKTTRNIVEFIEDYVSDGRSDSYIVAIAQNTRWRTQVDEIRIKLRKFRAYLKNRR